MKIGRAPARARSRARKLGYARCLIMEGIGLVHFYDGPSLVRIVITNIHTVRKKNYLSVWRDRG
jgi:hypothetical protein